MPFLSWPRRERTANASSRQTKFGIACAMCRRFNEENTESPDCECIRKRKCLNEMRDAQTGTKLNDERTEIMHHYRSTLKVK